jgi:hypothetical protein
MNKIGIYITSYNRPEMLSKLVDQIIQQMGGQINFDILIFDDKSDQLPIISTNLVTLITNEEHRGKEYYWKTWHEMFVIAHLRKDKYSFFLPDDITLCDNFFEIAIQKFEYLKPLDHKLACLSLLTDDQRKLAPHACWTGKQSKEQHGEILSHFNDCCFICDNKFFEYLDYTIQEIPLSRWNRDKNLSSGVGRQISLRLMNKEASMYHCFNSLVRHGEHESKMNPDERQINKLTSNF